MAAGNRFTALLVVLAASLALAAPGPARAESIASAQARVKELQQLQEQTTARLLEGTRRWEADQLKLKATHPVPARHS